jgi:hypothetical protein
MPTFAVPELALDHDQEHAFASHLDRVSVSKLMRRKASTYAGRRRRTRQVCSRGGA